MTTHPLYVALAVVAATALLWLALRFFAELRNILQYIRRTKKSGRVKSEIKRLRRVKGKRGK
ncbi:MAG TPA: hypothetical protein VJ032_15210 [Thermoanaerobaculia bacterium]|nr:hypothetical protein [Thermoanaerobaculia bacterium]